jgi:hypothetical protein
MGWCWNIGNAEVVGAECLSNTEGECDGVGNGKDMGGVNGPKSDWYVKEKGFYKLKADKFIY